MQAKRDYFLDEQGNVTTDAKKGVRFLARKGNYIRPAVAKEYGFKDGELATATAKTEKAPVTGKKAEAPTENKAAAPAATKKTTGNSK